MVDAIITYVSGNDPLWQQDYEQTIHKAPLTKRFRDWGTLRYLLRGIQACMPFVDNVYLVVSRDSQVPSWCDTEHLRIVRHEDIIPAEHLPTFNSAVIGLFLSKIPGIKERYIYFNDDIFPLKPCCEDLFFQDDRVAINFADCLFVKGYYKRHVRNSDRLAKKLLGRKPGLVYKRPQHSCIPMLKCACDEVWSLAGDEIMSSLSPVRSERNLNQSLFLNYLYYGGRAFSRRIPSKFFSLALATPEQIAQYILNPKKELLCINDVQMPVQKFEAYKSRIIEAFETRFPDKSQFEL